MCLNVAKDTKRISERIVKEKLTFVTIDRHKSQMYQTLVLFKKKHL